MAAPCKRPTTAEEALRELAEGNRRWRTFRERHPDETPTVRQTVATARHLFALVPGCVDFRVAPELVFDQGLGDLMTVRTAGRVLDEAVLGSLAYGVLGLGIPLLMVLGHQSCGAVRAAVQVDGSGAPLPPTSLPGRSDQSGHRAYEVRRRADRLHGRREHTARPVTTRGGTPARRQGGLGCTGRHPTAGAPPQRAS